MLTLMCPNCRHRFPAPGCCSDPSASVAMPTSGGDQFSTSCGGDYLVPRGYLNGGGGCVINAPTIIHGPTIIHAFQSPHDGVNVVQGHQGGFGNFMLRTEQSGKSLRPTSSSVDPRTIPSHCQVATSCDMTGGSVTIDLGSKDRQQQQQQQRDSPQSGIFQNPHPMLFSSPPSGCQELPGARSRTISPGDDGAKFANFKSQSRDEVERSSSGIPAADWSRSKQSESALLSQSQSNESTSLSKDVNLNVPKFDLSSSLSSSSSSGCSGSANFNKSFDVIQGESKISPSMNNATAGSLGGGGTVIQVNATLQLPPNVAHCTVSITATANSTPGSTIRSRNNFNGGGIVGTDSFGAIGSVNGCGFADRDDNSPTTPVSWVQPFPWVVNGNPGTTGTDLERLTAAQRVLQISGWYHEGLSWQQSSALLKNAPVGSWLMRDSSDERFMYAVSVQTARGPTAVRVLYVCGKFRLDAEPRMAPLMPMFDCPVKMIEYYIEYSKKMEEQKEVWVDHSGQLYSQIYLTKPLLKEVRSLSHLARLAVNRSKISIQVLPPPLRDYITEYPYTE